jgi:hypothetical protein
MSTLFYRADWVGRINTIDNAGQFVDSVEVRQSGKSFAKAWFEHGEVL